MCERCVNVNPCTLIVARDLITIRRARTQDEYHSTQIEYPRTHRKSATSSAPSSPTPGSWRGSLICFWIVFLRPFDYSTGAGTESEALRSKNADACFQEVKKTSHGGTSGSEPRSSWGHRCAMTRTAPTDCIMDDSLALLRHVLDRCSNAASGLMFNVFESSLEHGFETPIFFRHAGIKNHESLLQFFFLSSLYGSRTVLGAPQGHKRAFVALFRPKP